MVGQIVSPSAIDPTPPLKLVETENDPCEPTANADMEKIWIITVVAEESIMHASGRVPEHQRCPPTLVVRLERALIGLVVVASIGCGSFTRTKESANNEVSGLRAVDIRTTRFRPSCPGGGLCHEYQRNHQR